MAARAETVRQVESLAERYKYGFSTDIDMELAPKGLDEGPLAAAAGVEDNDAQLERLASLPSAYMLGPNMSLLRKRKIDPAAGLQSSILEDFSELSVQGGTEEI